MGMFDMFFGDGGEYEAKRRNTKSAHDLFGRSGAAYTGNREQIGTQYGKDLSAARARMGASGASSTEGPAWQRIVGGLSSRRDEALARVQGEQDVFEASTSYQLVREDFASMGQVKQIRKSRPMDGGQSKGREAYYVPTYQAEGMTGESFLNDEQKGMVKDSGLSTRSDYAASIKPSWEEYQEFRFGSDEDKAAFSDSMTSRIEASNIKYGKIQAQDTVIRAARDEAKRKMYVRDQNRK